MKWECDLRCCNAWFNQLRLGCCSDGGDINMNSFSQAAFFIIAANMLYRRKLPSLQAVALQWFVWGSPRCKCQNKAEDPVILSSSASLLLLGTISRGLYSSHLFFLKPCLFSVLSLPFTFHPKTLWAQSLFSEVTQIFRDSFQVGCAMESGPLP